MREQVSSEKIWQFFNGFSPCDGYLCPDYSVLGTSHLLSKISDQLIRSVMFVGANYEEARGADSRADFSHKLQIALKEMRESRYWLCLIAKLELNSGLKIHKPVDEATQLRAILAKSVATSRGKAKSD